MKQRFLLTLVEVPALLWLVCFCTDPLKFQQLHHTVFPYLLLTAAEPALRYFVPLHPLPDQKSSDRSSFFRNISEEAL